MQIVYIHGLNSDHNAEKGLLLDEFCQQHFPDIKVVRPDLNHPPAKVMNLLKEAIAKDEHTGLVGSSLGGFYATLMSNQTGCKTVLLNPSLNPANSLQRFFLDDEHKNIADFSADYVGHTTPGGWQITKADLDWFAQHRPTAATYPQKNLLIVKQGDELLNYQDSVDFFSHTQTSQPSNTNTQSHIIIEPGGNHQMTDFDTKLSQIIQFLFKQPRRD